jgi:hypothetical protein
MRVVDSLLNRSEELAFRELQNIADDNSLKVFPKNRMSDVISKENSYLTQREFDYYTRCHFDFVLTDMSHKPIMAVEYDGPFHSNETQIERDKIKNELRKRAEFGILRIHDRHVTRLYNGMSVLRWIVEVTELEKAFYQAQQDGFVPLDEPFDPMSFGTIGGTKKFPYWLSASATQSFHSFFRKLDPLVPKGWTSFFGRDEEGTAYRLSCLYFGEKILWSKTAVKHQDLNFPHYDLLSEIDTCELGIRFQLHRQGKLQAINAEKFRPIFESFCTKYKATPSHSSGQFPFSTSWNPTGGWK